MHTIIFRPAAVKRLIPQAALAGVFIAGVAAAFYFRDEFNVDIVQHWAQQAGPWAVVLFLLAYVAVTALFLPGSVLTLAGGAVFGPVWGTFYNLTGSTLGAMLAFLVARYVASDWVERTAGRRLKRLIRGVEKEGWRFVAFSRLMPIAPFNLLNYAFGLTRIKFSHYLIVTYIFLFPSTFTLTYMGFVGREALSGQEEDLIRNSLIAITLLAIIAYLPRIIIKYRLAAARHAARRAHARRVHSR
ncbi:MAG: TVP38/TMEM64 family protein [Gammaproteobacteria bacterium]